MFRRPTHDRLKKLARNLETLAERDQRRLEHESAIREVRRKAAVDLHGLLSSFVREVNQMVTRVRLELSPAGFTADEFQDPGTNLFQINVSGRVVQLTFRSTDLVESTLDLRTPYTLEGAIRWFNQEMLERDDVKEHELFYCLDKDGNGWRFLDRRGNRTGPVDDAYLTSIVEQLL